MTWIPDRIATAVRLWGEGQTATQIARHLGGVTRAGVLGMLHRRNLSRTVTPADQRKACSVPGCHRGLQPENTTEVCKDHLHAEGHCQCNRCQARASAKAQAARRVATVDRAHVRTALVPPTGNVTSGGDAHIRVSLPREPWVTG
jgi:hypothetical protein